MNKEISRRKFLGLFASAALTGCNVVRPKETYPTASPESTSVATATMRPTETRVLTGTPTPVPTASPTETVRPSFTLIPTARILESPTPTETPSVPLPYHSAFDAGLDSAWKQETGVWHAVGDQLQAEKNSGQWPTLALGDKSWEDYSVDIKLVWNGQPLRVETHRQEDGSGVFLEISNSGTVWYSQDPNGKRHEIGSTHGFVGGNKKSEELKIDVTKNNYRATLFNGEVFGVQVQDEKFKNGGMAISYNNASPMPFGINSVEVNPLP